MVQLLSEPISCTSMRFINGENWIKESTSLGMIMCTIDAALARWPARSFSHLGI